MRWIPLESNPEVLNKWAKQAGASQAEFVDIYGLDPELLALVPQPVKAVILLFPITEKIETHRLEVDAKIKEIGQHPIDPTLIYITQTIGNACGTMGLLHALMNSDTTIAPESPLAIFIDKCQGKSPAERAALLESTDIFASIHLDAAQQGQTEAPQADADVDLHFTCFVQAPSPTDDGDRRLIELDGRRGGPIDCGPSKNLLEDVASIVKDRYISLATNIHFSMVALAPPIAE